MDERVRCAWSLDPDGVRTVGFSSVAAYAVERCGYSGRWVEEARALARRLAGLPQLRTALLTGRVTWSMAQLVARHANAATDGEHVAAACGSTVRAMKAILEPRGPWQADPDETRPRRTIETVVDAEAAWAFERARMLVEAVTGDKAVFLATPFGANEAVLRPIADELAGKVLVDCTNPVGPGLSHGLGSARSGSEVVQALAPAARVVKAFTIYGYENLEDPGDPAAPLRPAMLFCGDAAAAKAVVARLIGDVGFEPLDVGGLVQALHLEHMTLLWVRLVRLQGHSPRLTWAALHTPPA